MLSAPPPHPRPFLEVFHSSAVHQHEKRDSTPSSGVGVGAAPTLTEESLPGFGRLPPELTSAGEDVTAGPSATSLCPRSSKHGQEMLWWGFVFSPLCSVRAQRTTWPSPAPAPSPQLCNSACSQEVPVRPQGAFQSS